MHNCRLTKNRLLELALNEVGQADEKQLLEALHDCPSCEEEYATIRNTLHVSTQALRSTLPAEDFWPGHHARLQLRLMNSLSPVQPLPLSLPARTWNALLQLATTSVRVPVPAALAIMTLIGIFVFTLLSRREANLVPSIPLASVETRTVAVPVIQEKVVTKVVYVEKAVRRSGRTVSHPDLTAPDSIARAGWETSGKSAMSLVGFKPTDQLKLTIIKRGYQNEK
jgi:xanthosine utilization system XapX-like protein